MALLLGGFRRKHVFTTGQLDPFSRFLEALPSESPRTCWTCSRRPCCDEILQARVQLGTVLEALRSYDTFDGDNQRGQWSYQGDVRGGGGQR